MIDVQELLNDVHCIIEAMIGRGSDVALRKPEMQDIPHVLLGDPDRVRGILLNLSTNAAKFTKKGDITMKVIQNTVQPRNPVIMVAHNRQRTYMVVSARLHSEL